MTIFCSRMDEDITSIRTVQLPNNAFFNHDHNLKFASDFAQRYRSQFDVVVGFNKLPGLDVLYCADPPSKQPASLLQRVNPRIRGYIRLDLTCFGALSNTRLLLLSDYQWLRYREIYGTDQERAEVLPPTVDARRVVSPEARPSVRGSVRQQFGIDDSTYVLLFIASYPAAKGLDRIIEALPSFPDARCMCVGFDAGDRRHSTLMRAARQAGVAHQLVFLGKRTDVPELMAASDILVHPSRKDVTGTVILEALINGLPVLVTDVCGYAPHVRRANAGVVVNSNPYDPRELRNAIELAREPTIRESWRRNASIYGANEDLHSGLDRAVSVIEEVGAKNSATEDALP